MIEPIEPVEPFVTVGIMKKNNGRKRLYCHTVVVVMVVSIWNGSGQTFKMDEKLHLRYWLLDRIIRFVRRPVALVRFEY